MFENVFNSSDKVETKINSVIASNKCINRISFQWKFSDQCLILESLLVFLLE